MSGPLAGSSAAIAASAVRVGLISLGLLGLALGLAACSRAVDPSPSASAGPGVELRAGELVRYDAQGRPLWALEAQRIEHLPDARKTRAEGVRLALYDAEGHEALIVTAEALLWDHSTGTLELSGGVRGAGTGTGGLRFSTERVRWDEATRTLQGEGPVEIERDDLRLAGEGFEFRPEDGTLIVQSAHLQLLLERRGRGGEP